jgi:hypothetical protein
MTANQNLEFENDRVRVTRVKHAGPGAISKGTRLDRLVIHLKDAHIKRTEAGHTEDIKRRAGEVVWRAGSEHEIEQVEDAEHEVLIVELKP